MRFQLLHKKPPPLKLRGWVFFFFLLLAAGARAQTVSLNVRAASLESVFNEIKRQTGYSFVYSSERIRGANPVSITVTNSTLSKVLELLFRDQPLRYDIQKNYVIISEKPLPSKTEIYTCKGRVVSEKGEAIAKASVKVKRSSEGTATDEDGNFLLRTDTENPVLVVSCVGYEETEFAVFTGKMLTLSLKTAVNKLDEQVVIAYGQTTKRMNTGNVSKITAEVIQQQPVSNFLSAIQGRAPGVFVNTQNGLPGGNISVQIRGKGSINAGTDPLYVVDGVPFISTPLNQAMSVLSTGIGGSISPLNSLNPADIESIEILKDAEAAAIYGSRAANGVILITTKKGRTGKTKVDLNFYQGFSRLSEFPELMNVKQYLAVRREAFANDGITPTVSNAPDLLVWDTTSSRNWPKYIFGGTAPTQQAQVEASGGNQATNFLLSANYRRDGSILPGDQFYTRSGARLALHHAPVKQFSLDFSSTYSTDDNRLLSSSAFSMLTLPPNLPLYDNSGNYNWVGISDANPDALLKRHSSSQAENLLANLTIGYSPFDHFEFRVNAGYTTIRLDQVMTYPLVSLNPNFGLTSYAYYGTNRNKNYLIEQQGEYTRSFGRSHLTVLLGGSWQNTVRDGTFISGSNYSNDELLEYAAAAGTLSVSNIYSQYKYASLFGRIGYDYGQKYLVNLSARRDGSSRFGPGDPFGNFGSVSLGWIFTKEKIFEKLGFISFGKIRSSYGITGNDQITDYQYLPSYKTGVVYQGITGLTPSRIANADFGWESNKKLELAMELGFVKDRILTSVSFYRNRSGNQLMDYPLPFTSGPFGSYQANLPALVENRGWEFELTATLIRKKKSTLSLSGNFTMPQNKLLNYPGLASSAFANTYVIGEDLSIRKALHYMGADPQSGVPRYEDVNRDGQISTPLDYTVAGRTSPYFYGGAGCNFLYGQFECNVFFQFCKQFIQGLIDVPGSRKNYFTSSLQRWQRPGDIEWLPKATTVNTTPYSNLALSDAAFYNASYIRLKNIHVAYRLKDKTAGRLKISGSKLFAECENILTWRTQGNYYDPETGLGGVPPLKTLALGIQLTF